MEGAKTPVSDYIREKLEKIAEQEGFVEYEVGNFSQPNVTGYMSNIVCAVIEGKRTINGCIKDDKLHLICKYPSPNQSMREIFNVINQFKREIYIYNNVLPAFTEFQKDKGLSEEDGFYTFPKCYLAEYCKERDEHLIILENLANEVYTISDYEMNLNINHSKIFFKNLAKLHAISFAIRDQNPNLLNKFKLNLADIYVPHHTGSELFKQGYLFSFRHAIKSLHPDELVEIAKLEEIQSKFTETLVKTVDIDASEPFAVINHGECWNKNLLFQYNSENIPQQFKFCDFQLSRYGSPALDIAFYMLISTTSEFRNMYYNELIQFYYDTLVQTLALLGSDAQKLITFENLQDQLIKFGKFGSILASVYIQVLTFDQSQLKDMDSFSENLSELKISDNRDVFENINLCKAYNEHMSGVVRDSVKYGYY